MRHRTDPLRVALGVVPPLLADALSVLLADPRIELSTPVEPGPRPVDVLILSPGCDTGVDVPIRIELDGATSSRGGATVTSGAGQVTWLADLEALRRFVWELATDEVRGLAHTEWQRGHEAGTRPHAPIDVEVAAERPQ